MEQAKSVAHIARRNLIYVFAAVVLVLSLTAIVISVFNTVRIANEANQRSKQNQTIFCGSALAIGNLPTDLFPTTTPAGASNQDRLQAIIVANKQQAMALHCKNVGASIK